MSILSPRRATVIVATAFGLVTAMATPASADNSYNPTLEDGTARLTAASGSPPPTVDIPLGADPSMGSCPASAVQVDTDTTAGTVEVSQLDTTGVLDNILSDDWIVEMNLFSGVGSTHTGNYDDVGASNLIGNTDPLDLGVRVDIYQGDATDCTKDDATAECTYFVEIELSGSVNADDIDNIPSGAEASLTGATTFGPDSGALACNAPWSTYDGGSGEILVADPMILEFP